jgi:hypothetical protein
MSGAKVLACALLMVVRAASQNVPKVVSPPQTATSSPTAQAQCKFSDGKTITVDYSTRHIKVDVPTYQPYGAVWQTVFNDIRFVTDEGLITVKGMGVPAGDYTIAVVFHYPRVFPSLIMMSRQGGELRVPLSATKLASPAENSAISFEHTGGSCMMHVNEKNWNTQLSLEFTEKNADLPLEN